MCAPCQPFSSQNRYRRDDSRAALLVQSVKFVKTLSPGAVLFENVSGLAALESNHLLYRLRAELKTVGYLLGSPRRIDAADLGVPQRRVRCVMIAAKDPGALERFESAELLISSATVRRAIEHLPALGNGERSEHDPLHYARKHQDIVLQRLQHIPRPGRAAAGLISRPTLNSSATVGGLSPSPTSTGG